MQNPSNKRIVYDLKKLGIKGCLDFGYYNYHNAEPRLATHKHHNSIEICYYLKGEQHYQINDEIFKLKGNDFLIVPPDVPHSTGNYPEDIGELFWLQLSLDMQGRIGHLPKKESHFLWEKLTTKTNKVFEGTFKVKPILEKILVNLKNSKKISNNIIINTLLIQLLLETLALTKKKPQTSPIKKLKVIDSFIQENMDRQIYVDELASLLSLSTTYFKIWFKKNFGTPPKTYVNRIKIKHAKALMQTESNITRIAFELGFNSSQYFATVFRKHTGMTPKKYIQSIKY